MLGFKLEFIGCVCNGLHVDHIDRLAERESSLLSAMRCGHRGRNATALPVCNILFASTHTTYWLALQQVGHCDDHDVLAGGIWMHI